MSSKRTARPARRYSGRFALSLAVIVACAAATLGVGLAAKMRAEQIMGQMLLQGSNAVALDTSALRRMLSTLGRDLNFLQSQLQFEGCTGDAAASRLGCPQRVWKQFMAVRPEFDQIRWLDAQGLERIRVDRGIDGVRVVPERDLQDKGGRYYVRDALALPADAVYVSRLDLNVERGEIERPLKPMLRVATRVFDAHGTARGLVILNYRAAELLQALDSPESNPNRDAGWLVNEDGFWLRGPGREDEWGFMLGRPERTLSHLDPDAWAAIRSERAGQIRTSTGLWSFDTVRPVDAIASAGAAAGSGNDRQAGSAPRLDVAGEQWKVVNRIPSSVYGQALRNMQLRYAGILAAFLLTMIGSGWALHRGQRRELAAREAAARRDAESRLGSLVEQGLAGVAEFDLEFRLRSANDRFCAIVGRSRDWLLGRAIEAFSTVEEWTFERSLLRGMMAGERPPPFDKSYRHSDGAISWARHAFSLMRDAADNPVGYLLLLTDVSETKKAEEDLRELNAVLEQRVAERTAAAHAAAKAKSVFLANTSHEVRTPLNAVLGFLDLLLETDLDPRQRGLAQKVERSAKALLRILNDILDVSQLDAGRLELKHEAFDLQSVLRETVELFHLDATQSGLMLILTTRDGLADAYRGDALRIGQILNNLIGNAIKFSERGVVEVSAAVLSAADGRHEIGFEVRDTGIGLTTEEAEQLFQPFTQVDASSTRRFGGAGLGLSICRNLTELMGGTIGVESTPGQGSRFWFRLTLEVAPASAVTPATGRSPLEGLLDSDAVVQRLHDADVLLVEDNPTNRVVALSMLRRLGVQVDVAENGQQALEHLAERQAALVLMDLHMPVMGGLDATRAIRAADWGREIPIIAMSAAAFPEEREQAIAAGMNDFVPKPVDRGRLIAALLRWLPAPRPSSDAAAPRAGVVLEPGPRPESKQAPESEQVLEQEPDQERADDLQDGTSAPVPTATPSGQSNATDGARAAEPIDGPVLQGFDLQGALDRLGGDRRLLDTILAEFRRELIYWSDAIRAAHDAGDDDEARRLAHSLKGAAGAVGAVDIEADARALEAAIGARQTPERVEALLADCCASVATAAEQLDGYLNELARVAEANLPAGSTMSATELGELATLLRRHRWIPEEMRERLRQAAAVQGPRAALFARLHRRVNSFAFADALGILDEIEREPEVSAGVEPGVRRGAQRSPDRPGPIESSTADVQRGQTESAGRALLLLVDDDPTSLRLAGSILRADHDLMIATTGEEAVGRIGESPSLILLDHHLPDCTGLDVCRRLKQDPAGAEIPVIFVTGNHDSVLEAKGLRAGAVDFVTKPYSSAVLKARVATQLKLKTQTDRLARLAELDGLTGVANRHALDEVLRREWERAQRLGTPLSAVMIDADRFKAVNDRYGHLEGDRCLRLIAESIQRYLRSPRDSVARYGGEEFLLLLPDTDAPAAVDLAEEIRLGVQNRFIDETRTRPDRPRLTVSLGCATLVPDGRNSIATLLRTADERLYQAKEMGRNRVVASEALACS